MNEQVPVPKDSETDFTPDDNNPIQITSRALEAFKEALEEHAGNEMAFRVSVLGGGCAGYRYHLDFEDKRREEDRVIACADLNVYVDFASASLLWGTVIDYVSEAQSSGFKFINPNARRTCGGCHQTEPDPE
ncbi:iron-sulfur cluster assembly accessory protein [Oligoflexia bacterium]|nr:iron-sulfur cluster assembly accessory protein [Oligoflexia bacterium]